MRHQSGPFVENQRQQIQSQFGAWVTLFGNNETQCCKQFFFLNFSFLCVCDCMYILLLCQQQWQPLWCPLFEECVHLVQWFAWLLPLFVSLILLGQWQWSSASQQKKSITLVVCSATDVSGSGMEWQCRRHFRMQGSAFVVWGEVQMFACDMQCCWSAKANCNYSQYHPKRQHNEKQKRLIEVVDENEN